MGLTAGFSLQVCDAHMLTGSITFSKIHFSWDQILHFYLYASFSCPLSIGSELDQERGV